MSEAKRLIRNTGILAIGGMATKLVQFLLLPLYTSMLSPAEYGMVDYLNTIVLFCVPAVSLLMDEALFRFLIDCRDDADRRHTVTACCAVMFLGCLVFCLGSLVVDLVFHPDYLWWAAALVLVSSFLGMNSAVLRGFGDMASYTVLNFSASALTICLNVVFIAVFRWGVFGMLSATAIARTLAASVSFVRNRLWSYIIVSSFSLGYVKRLLRYSIPLIPNRISWNIMEMSSRLIIMNVLGADASGLYAVSTKFPDVMNQLYSFFSVSWMESSARALNEGGEGRFYNEVYRALRRLMMSVVLLMTALMPFAYGILVNESYVSGIVYVPILLLGMYFNNVSCFYGGIFTAHKDTSVIGATTIFSAAMCLVLNIALIPTVGLYGAALSNLFAMVSVNEYRRIKVRRYSKFMEDRRERAVTIVAVALVLGLFYFNSYSPVFAVQLAAVAASLVYAVGMNAGLFKRVITSVRKDR